MVWVVNLKKKKYINTYIFYIVIGIVILLVTFPSIPVLKGTIVNMYTPRNVPSDYLQLKNYLIKDNAYSRVFWIPAYSRWGLATSTHPQVNGFDAIVSEWNTFSNEFKEPGVDFHGDIIFKLLNKDFANNLLDKSSIKYIVVPIEDTENHDNFFTFYGEKRQTYIEELDKLDYLHKLNLELDNLVVYENYNSRPHIYVTSNPDSIYENVPYQEVDFRQVSQYQYEIKLKNIDKEVYLHLGEKFNTGWNLRVGDFTWYDSLYESNYFINKKFHIKNDAILNTYKIDTNKICNVSNCSKNSDGTYNLVANIYYVPQSYLNIGMVIFFLTLIPTLVYILYELHKTKNEKNNKSV
jgi:hypothetical protein